MDHTETILSLVEAAVRDDLSATQIVERAAELAREGIPAEAVEEVLDGVLGDSVSPIVVDVVGNICASLLRESGMPERAGNALLQVANELSDRFDIASLSLAISHFERARAYLPADDEDLGAAFVNEAITRQTLAEMGVEQMKHLTTALELFQHGRQRFDDDSRQYALALMNEGNVHLTFAQMGHLAIHHLQSALEIYGSARQMVHDEDDDMGTILLNEATARMNLAELGQDPVQNLRRCIGMIRNARRCFQNDADRAATLMNEGAAHLTLAELGVRPRKHLKIALRQLREARRLHDPTTPDHARTQINEGTVRVRLAELGIRPVDNFDRAIRRYRQARRGGRLDRTTPSYGRALMHEGTSHLRLGEMGIEPIRNLQTAVKLFRRSRRRFDKKTRSYANAQVNEGTARVRLADEAVDRQENLKAAILLNRRARNRFDSNTPAFGTSLMNEANARVRLDLLEKTGVRNLEKAVNLYSRAYACFDPQGHSFANTLLNEANARVRLGLRQDEATRVQQLQQAVELYEQATHALEHGTPDWGTAQRNLAYALRHMGRTEEALERLKQGLEMIETIRGRMRREPERIAYFESSASHYASTVDLCLSRSNSTNDSQNVWDAWHWVHRSKSRALLELLRGARPKLVPEHEQLWNEYESVAESLDQLERYTKARRVALESTSVEKGLTASEAEPELADQQVKLSQLRQEYDAKRSNVLASIERARPLETVDVPSPQEVARQLRGLAATTDQLSCRPLLIEFFTLSENELCAFLLPLWTNATPTVERIVVKAGSARQLARSLRDAVGKLQDRTRVVTIEQSQSGSEGDRQTGHQQFAQLLADMQALIDPLGPIFDELRPTELVVSPHFLLNLLPLHAVNWRGRPLIEQYPVSYLPSPALADEFARRRKPVGGRAILIGNPAGGLRSLHEAENEVQWVRRLLESRNIHCTSLVGRDATTDKVELHADSCDLLHFACHSTLESGDFLRSGLDLANRRLSVLDVMGNIDLTNAACVYLGSCDSAQALPGKSDELMALTRAFLYAGSPSVIASLWTLDDTSAARFAASFYRSWLSNKLPMNVAFQQATLATKQRFPQPFHWAPFILLGAWNQLAQGDKDE